MKPPPHIQRILDLWQRLTGQTWRALPFQVQEAAQQFHDSGFTEEEVHMVLSYTRREIGRNSSGFNGQSITWRVLSEDHWARFQERLALAREADKRKPLPKLPVAVTRPHPDGGTVTVLDVPAEKPVAPLDVAAGLRGLADRIAKRN